MPAPTAISPLRRTVTSVLLLTCAAGAAGGIYLWKLGNVAAAAAAAASQPEPAEAVESALVTHRSYTPGTTAIATVRALQSITLRNELPGTVRKVMLQTGASVAAGELLVELDIAVEQAELAALEAEARLAESMLRRMEQALAQQGASAADVDRARAEHDKANANVVRIAALIERKRLRAPFPAKVGMVDLHVGQYLEPGTALTTLQGMDAGVHLDFAVTQETAARLQVGRAIEVTCAGKTVLAPIVALDARVDASTRNTTVRALLRGVEPLPLPGASLRVTVPVAEPQQVLVVPVSALRRGPGGDHVFMLAATPEGQIRAQTRRIVAGPALGDEVIVREGLQAGERVATTGSFKLREGALVVDQSQPAVTPTQKGE
jgi:membrane fusion protein (multidrug efflux system)